MKPNYVEKVRENLQKIEKYCRLTLIPALKETDFCQLNSKWQAVDEILAHKPTTYIFSVDRDGELTLRVNSLVLKFGPEYDESNIYDNLVYAVRLIRAWSEVKHELTLHLTSLDKDVRFMNDFEA